MPSNDPKQQALRTVKRRFNIGYKNFSQRLKGLKDGINGRASKVGIPASNIKDPLPGEVGTVLEQLASEFAQLVDSAHSIIDEQGMYSKTRRKKQPKHRQQEMPTAEAPEQEAGGGEKLVEQLSRLGSADEDILISEASNRFTRLWQYIKSPITGRSEKERHRIQLLKLFADTFYRTLDFENAVLIPDLGHMPETVNTFQLLRYSFDSVKDSFLVYRDKDVREKARIAEEHEKKRAEEAMQANEEAEEPEAKPQEEQVAQKPEQNEEQAKREEANRESVLASLRKTEEELGLVFETFGWSSVGNVLSIIAMFLKRASSNYQAFMKQKTVVDKKISELAGNEQYWKDLMKAAAKRYGKDKFANIKKKADLMARLKQAVAENWPVIDGSGGKRAAEGSDRIVKLSHNVLTRALRRQLIKLIPFNKTAVHRLDIVANLDKIKHELKEAMSSIEKGIDVKALKDRIKTIDELLNETTSLVRIINVLFEQKTFEERKKRKTRTGEEYDPISDFLMRRKLRRDLHRGLYSIDNRRDE